MEISVTTVFFFTAIVPIQRVVEQQQSNMASFVMIASFLVYLIGFLIIYEYAPLGRREFSLLTLQCSISFVGVIGTFWPQGIHLIGMGVRWLVIEGLPVLIRRTTSLLPFQFWGNN